MKNSEDSYFDLNQYRRVLEYATKPERQELIKVTIVAALSILLIGIVGFAIFFLMTFVPG